MRTIVASAFLCVFCLSGCAASPAKQLTASMTAKEPVESCAAFSPAADDFVVLPALRVGRLGDDEDFVLPENAPRDASFIQCERDDLIPLPSDYKVLAAGLPLVIGAGERVATLEISEARVNFRALKGEFTDEEIPLIQAYLNRAQQLLDALSDEA
jgi:hypothetical protein